MPALTPITPPDHTIRRPLFIAVAVLASLVAGYVAGRSDRSPRQADPIPERIGISQEGAYNPMSGMYRVHLYAIDGKPTRRLPDPPPGATVIVQTFGPRVVVWMHREPDQSTGP